MNIPLDTVIQFLEDELLGPYTIEEDSGLEWKIQLNDPFADYDSRMRCGIRAKADSTFYNCWKSEFKGIFFDFVRRVKNLNSIAEAEEYYKDTYFTLEMHFREPKPITTIKKAPKKTAEIPDHFQRFDAAHHKEYLDYCVGRGIPEKRLLNLRLFVDPRQKRIVFPIYSPGGNLLQYAGRAINENKLRWLNSKTSEVYPIFNLENVNGGTCVIFEGIFDALTVRNGVALLGAKMNANMYEQILNKSFNKICVVMDNNRVGDEARYEIAETFGKFHSNVYYYQFFTDYDDFGEIAKAGLDAQDILDKGLKVWDPFLSPLESKK